MTIGILSWGARGTLENTLKSYRKYGLDALEQEKIIFFQEITNEDRELAKEYGYKATGSPINIGIAHGYKSLVELATNDLFLFLENDWELIEEPHDQLFEAADLLRRETVDVVRLRHRRNPGKPLWSELYKGNELSDRGQNFLLDSIHWTEDENISSIISHEDDWFITTAQFANWTNNPTMFRTKWLKEQIVPRMGNIDVEIDIQNWWKDQKYHVAQSAKGLFTHNRLDR